MNNFQNTINLQEPDEPVDPYPVSDPNVEPDNKPAIEPDPYPVSDPVSNPEALPGTPSAPDNPVSIPPEPVPANPPNVTF